MICSVLGDDKCFKALDGIRRKGEKADVVQQL